MKTTGSPFAFIDGKPYIIVNFTLDTAFGFPSLTALLEELLGQCSGDEILLLRRLTLDESDQLAGRLNDAEHEAWAVISARFKKRKE